MRPLVQYGSRSTKNLSCFSIVTGRAPLAHLNPARATNPPPSLRRQFRALSSRPQIPTPLAALWQRCPTDAQNFRAFHASTRALDADSKKQEVEPKLAEEALESDRDSTRETTRDSPIDAPISSITPSATSPASEESLPSSRDQQRWDSSKRLAQLMEEAQERIAILTHKVNNYTGTDYSGIQELRQQIKEQEDEVKARRAAIVGAKHALDAAFAQKATSQKEVVGLLERKHSWSDSDLERYMSLVRSEHLNDQAVQNAKDKVSQAERDLEEARAQLEKVERKQYHEEQIWSDTIRRNSTWVTFGLMGFNVLVLLASIALLEPWRRKRLVREIRSALEEHRPVLISTNAELPAHTPDTPVDSVVESSNVTVEEVCGVEIDSRGAEADTDRNIQTSPIIEPKADPEPTPDTGEDEPQVILNDAATARTPYDRVEELKSFVADLFSEGTVTIRQVDITTWVLEGFTVGAAVVGLLVVLMRSTS